MYWLPKSNKISTIIILLLFLTLKVYAQDEYYDEDDDDISISSSFIMALVGGGIFLFGRMLSEVKSISGLGTVITFIGGFVGVLGILGIAIVILEAAIGLAVKIAIVIGAILIVLWLIKGAGQMFNEKNEKPKN